MGFVKTAGFKYLKNFIIGVGAAIVLIGALFKLESWPYASEMLITGLSVEAFIFLFLGIIGPEKDYYWEKLYPGLDDYHSHISSITQGEKPAAAVPQLNGQVVENKLGGMLDELQSMSKSLGSLKALQEADFSGTADQVKAMGNFYAKLNGAMSELAQSVEDTKAYKDNLTALNKNLGSLNSVYGGMLNAMSNIGKS
ncbi:MAG TPA: gliding motility protein GldL [Saprospiraceae bacterium]|nr:gliding motility protein GldL [Saprospiraceae bacterium]MCC6688482.1 gliding motility protein GldL [Saprospiraceae bacterium]HMV23394.1 gliding motility protein GldL [Saprospiraceae bacterium]HMX85734.1 gliding motility protein GldL [Saprospiraceae bacterium]HMZ74009.1 gliding motility protein GldL [Saprospiraceae bacterium]